jgi:hypothetical protein
MGLGLALGPVRGHTKALLAWVGGMGIGDIVLLITLVVF